MRGGKKDQFYFCRLEYYSEDKRWFLRSLLQVNDELDELDRDSEEPSEKTEGTNNSKQLDGDIAIHKWIEEFELKHLVIDFPLSPPTSLTLDLGWPDTQRPEGGSIQIVKEKIKEILDHDEKMLRENPKQYERERNSDDEVSYSESLFKKQTTHHLLSRSFKRKLKKGFIPYWNRTLDFWIWTEYYDQLLKLFNISYDSFGNTALMVLFRFNYLRKKFPADLKLHEANTNIILLELLRCGLITKRDLVNIRKLEEGPEAKLNIIKAIESKLGVFIYDHDLEILVKNPRAFQSFLLTVAGMIYLNNSTIKLPDWTLPWQTSFLVPNFKKYT